MHKRILILALVLISSLTKAQVSETFNPFGFIEDYGYRYINGFDFHAQIKNMPN
ncbi:MAG: hypothetical protein HYZ42_00675 [Bacteroidetes bacterium]|nr:hypothetical protein [Bacteroidota bacterium]